MSTIPLVIQGSLLNAAEWFALKNDNEILSFILTGRVQLMNGNVKMKGFLLNIYYIYVYIFIYIYCILKQTKALVFY